MVRQIQCHLRFTGSTNKPTWKKGFVRVIAVDTRPTFQKLPADQFKKWRKVNLQVRTGLWKTKNSRL